VYAVADVLLVMCTAFDPGMMQVAPAYILPKVSYPR
jgi:hypothetical protein